MKRIIQIGIIIFTLLAFIQGVSHSQTQAKSPEQARLLARRAAISDCQRNLAEIIYGIKLDAKTTVRNFVTQNDLIKSHLQAVLQGAQLVDTKWEPDGTCTVKMEVPVALLQKALEHKFAYISDVIAATGHGAPNPIAAATPAQATFAPEESWHTLLIKATGAGTAPKDLADTPQGRLMAERAAYADALRQLGENIMGVHITSRTTVRNLVTENDEIKTKFQAYMQNAKKIDIRHLDNGTCEVDLELPLEGLRQQIQRAPSPSPQYFRPGKKPREGR